MGFPTGTLSNFRCPVSPRSAAPIVPAIAKATLLLCSMQPSTRTIPVVANQLI
jgi:hypothetical protein